MTERYRRIVSEITTPAERGFLMVPLGSGHTAATLKEVFNEAGFEALAYAVLKLERQLKDCQK